MKMHTASSSVNAKGCADARADEILSQFLGVEGPRKPHTHDLSPVFYEPPDSVQVAMTLDALGLLEKLHRERADLSWASLTPAHAPLVRELGVLGLVTCDGDGNVTLTDWGRNVFGAYTSASGLVMVRVPANFWNNNGNNGGAAWSAPYPPRRKQSITPPPAAPPCPPPAPPKPSKPPTPKHPKPTQPPKPPSLPPRRPILSEQPSPPEPAASCAANGDNPNQQDPNDYMVRCLKCGSIYLMGVWWTDPPSWLCEECGSSEATRENDEHKMRCAECGGYQIAGAWWTRPPSWFCEACGCTRITYKNDDEGAVPLPARELRPDEQERLDKPDTQGPLDEDELVPWSDDEEPEDDQEAEGDEGALDVLTDWDIEQMIAEEDRLREDNYPYDEPDDGELAEAESYQRAWAKREYGDPNDAETQEEYEARVALDDQRDQGTPSYKLDDCDLT
jgi:hypothetical protein